METNVIRDELPHICTTFSLIDIFPPNGCYMVDFMLFFARAYKREWKRARQIATNMVLLWWSGTNEAIKILTPFTVAGRCLCVFWVVVIALIWDSMSHNHSKHAWHWLHMRREPVSFWSNTHLPFIPEQHIIILLCLDTACRDFECSVWFSYCVKSTLAFHTIAMCPYPYAVWHSLMEECYIYCYVDGSPVHAGILVY